ncbi:FeoA family protein [Thermodesulfobacterium hveragerdense]|uniref:FeoA family protein n=1 Tax=Thermodesulfobacterium hveragerdense TaxID=53424 RepID=UPI000408F3B4|nr:FeoA family protein [Thermodesulfobacterium hveragerdense]
MLLVEAKCGDKVKIEEFLGEDAIIKKIEAMGLRKGDVFEVLRVWGRNFLLKNENSRVVISFDVAKNIVVDLLGKMVRIECECKPCKKKKHRWGWL